MPGGLNGRELADLIHAEQPTLPVILATGYSREVPGQYLIPREHLHFLSKPFDLPTLMRSVRHALDHR